MFSSCLLSRKKENGQPNRLPWPRPARGCQVDTASVGNGVQEPYLEDRMEDGQEHLGDSGRRAKMKDWG